MNELNDKDLREALSRREARRTKPEVPADFCDGIMQEIVPRRSRRPLWRWVAVAASLLLLIGIGVALVPFNKQTEAGSLIVQTVQPVRTDSTGTPSKQTVKSAQAVCTTTSPTPKPVKVTPKTPVDTVAVSLHTDPNLHYAVYSPEEDSTYQAPSRMVEFITKIADYNKVKAVPLMCSIGSSDSTAVSMAYVFEDKEELNLFGRLLQAACWYDSKTPGYLLNFSHQQFFFTLKDLRKNEKYLWIAERIIGDRILLFSSHSPIEADVSSVCYQNYREQLMHTNYSTSNF
ncbi:hypothetical protein SAMN04487902_11313 [Prevotella sp. ne3005]|uniref:anti-sigma factor family protein n=1 Tax=Prevotella sp. ne3005 TaxID=1761887 RepID=UPI0008BB7BB3|nr:hypothetical protein [Prevotella sp. ne3005]SEN35173.1 hypothetical protein SAMN04487902_11313 [Prevotella sp. ne3005]